MTRELKTLLCIVALTFVGASFATAQDDIADRIVYDAISGKVSESRQLRESQRQHAETLAADKERTLFIVGAVVFAAVAIAVPLTINAMKKPEPKGKDGEK